MSLEISSTTPAFPPADPAKTAELFNGLRTMIAACADGANKHDLLTVCIEACLDEGINTRAQLIGVLGRLGFKRGHICILLDRETGFSPVSHRWSKNVQDGTYSRLETRRNPPSTTNEPEAA